MPRVGGQGVGNDEPLDAVDIAFDNTGLKFNATETQSAIEDLRQKDIQSIHALTSSLNGTEVLTVSSNSVQIVTGTATGYKIDLPDATTLFNGRTFKVTNNSDESILVRDDAGTTLATLIAGDSASFLLEDNLTAAGSWLTTINTSAATGITSYVVETATAFNTNSSSDVIITGFTITPVTGRYAV